MLFLFIIKNVCLLILVLFPAILFAQIPLYSNPLPSQVEQEDCAERLFTKVQVPPSLKISKAAFEDTLTRELKQMNFRFKDNEITYKFLVTSHSGIYDFRIDSGSIAKEEKLRETLLRMADLWLPAKQNGRIVCAYIKLKVSVINGKIYTDIFQ